MDLALLEHIARDNGGLVTRVQTRDAQVSSRQLTTLVRWGVVARVARGVYAFGGVCREDPREIALSWNVILSFESAAAWYGVDLPAPLRTLHVTAPRNRGRWCDRVTGIRLHRAAVKPADIVIVRGVRITAPIRTALDISRHCRLDHAVAIVDAYMRAGAFTVEEFQAAALAALGPGRLRIQTVASLVDPDSGSILESLTRVLLWRAGLPRPNSQHSFRSAHGWVGYVDFAWPDLKAILECDGYEFHTGRGPFQKDRRRWSAVSVAGWHIAVVTWFDVTTDLTTSWRWSATC